MHFHEGKCRLTDRQTHHRVRLSIATLTTLLLGYKTAAKLASLQRITASRESITMLDNILLHEIPYISDYI